MIANSPKPLIYNILKRVDMVKRNEWMSFFFKNKRNRIEWLTRVGLLSDCCWKCKIELTNENQWRVCDRQTSLKTTDALSSFPNRQMLQRFFLKGRRPTAERLAAKSLSPRWAADLISLPVVGQHTHTFRSFFFFLFKFYSLSSFFYPPMRKHCFLSKESWCHQNSFRHIASSFSRLSIYEREKKKRLGEKKTHTHKMESIEWKYSKACMYYKCQGPGCDGKMFGSYKRWVI